MAGPSRRTILSSSVAVLGLSAGCIADDNGSGSTSDGNGDGGNDTADDEHSTGESGEGDAGSDDFTLPDGLSGYATHAHQSPERSTSPDVSLLLDTPSADDWLAERDSTSDGLSEFVDETDFGTSVLVSLEAGAPDPCHELALEGIGIDESGDGDDALTLEARVREAPGSEDKACIARETTVGRLVRVSFESDRLTTVAASIVDRNGTEHGIGVSSDSASASASDGSSSTETGDS